MFEAGAPIPEFLLYWMLYLAALLNSCVIFCNVITGEGNTCTEMQVLPAGAKEKDRTLIARVNLESEP